MPKWVHSTLQGAGDLVGDPLNQRRMRSQFEEPPHSLVATKPVMHMHFYMVQASNPQPYAEVAGNLLKNQNRDLVLLPSDMKLFKCIWVHRTKREVDGQVRRYKARQVSKRLQQIHTYFYIFNKIFTEHNLAHLRGLFGVKDTTS
jgi:hypothetical protein